MNKLILKYQQGGTYYTVQKGNSPWQIAHDNGMDLEEFYELNPFARKMIHPGDRVRLKSKPKPKITYVPRQSVELLSGVTVTAKKKPSSNHSYYLNFKKYVATAKNKKDSKEVPSIPTQNYLKSKIVDLVNKSKTKLATKVKNLDLEQDFKDDLIGILSAPSLKDSYDTAVYGLGRKADKVKDKVKPKLDSIYEFFVPLSETIVPVPKEFYKKYNIESPKTKFEKQLELKTDSLLDLKNKLAGLVYKASLPDQGKWSLRRNSAPYRYVTRENINLLDFTLGTRNRSDKYNNRGLSVGVERDKRPINNTSGIIISSYNPFLEYGNSALTNGYADMPGKSWNYYYGIDSNGNFVHGNNYSKFKPGDVLTRSMAHKITSAERGADPYLITLTKSDGTKTRMNMTSATKDIDSYHRGRELLVAGDEARLVSGTVEDLNKEIQSMKLRHGVDYVTLVELDNGSFSEGLRTTTGKLSSDDVNSYLGRNSRNGHFMYIDTSSKKSAGPKTFNKNDISLFESFTGKLYE